MPILLITIALSGLGFGLVLPGMPFVAQNLGASPFWAAVLLGLYAWGQLISTFVWGRLSDRIGRKPVLVITNLGTAVAYLLMAFAPNVWVLAAGRALSGLMGGIAPAMAYVSDVTPPEKRAQGMGWVGAAMSFGFVIGPAIGGVLGGTEAGEASLFLPGIVAFLIAAGTAAGTVFLLPESLPPEKRTQGAANHGGSKGPSLVELLRRPLMPQVLLLGFSVYVAMAMFETIFPFWAREQFNWGPREVGLSFTYLAVVVGIMQGFVVGRLAPRFGEGRLATVAIASYAVGLVWMTQAPNWIWMLVGVTLTSAGGGTFLTSMSSFVSKTAGANERGTVLGTYQSASWGGRALGPIAAGAFYNTLGHQSPLLAGAVIMLPCVALLAWITARSAAATERTV